MDTQTKVVMLNPAVLMASTNIRFGLKKYRVKHLADQIKAVGSVQTPLQVESLSEEGPNGEMYVIRAGHYRHAAVTELNKLGGTYELPCIVEEPLEGVERIKRQLSENLDRENLSVMDTAVAIKDLLEAGMPRVEVREVFVRPSGRKGLTMQPLSNESLHLYTRLLKLPKAIQTKLHDGTMNLSAANVLLQQPEDKWAGILEKIEADRLAVMDREEKSEDEFLTAEKKETEKSAKEKAESEALETAAITAAAKEKEAAEKLNAAADAYKELSNAKAAGNKEGAKKAEESLKAKESEAKEAEKQATQAKKAAETLQIKRDKNAKLAQERREKLELARKEAAAKAPVKAEDVKKAVAKDKGEHVALNGPEMRKCINELAGPGSFPKVTLIGKSIKKCFDGVTTHAQMLSELGFLTGERKDKPKTLAKE